MDDSDAAVAVAPGDEDQHKVEDEAKVIARESIKRAAEGAYGEVDPGLAAQVATLPAKPVYAIVLGVESGRMYFGRLALGAEFFATTTLVEARRIGDETIGDTIPKVWFSERTVMLICSDDDAKMMNDGELPDGDRMVDYGIGDF